MLSALTYFGLCDILAFFTRGVRMKIDCVVLGGFETNSYVLRKNESYVDCLVVDTGLEAEPLVDFLKSRKLNPVAIVLTHGHADHIAGVELLRAQFPEIKVYVHKLDAPMLTGAAANLSELAGVSLKTDPADVLLDEGDVIEQAGIALGVLHTPGHTPGGICLYSREHSIVFVGDTLFAGSVGRTDFPGGNMDLLIKSIKEKLLSLPDDTIVLPGHGPGTKIADEKLANPFLT
jgi:glyoxylase-like metal-dependent hydrolase (beta-lactamase superfamily II)